MVILVNEVNFTPMSNPPLPLESGEQLLGTWTLNYLPPKEGRYLGKFFVTNKRLFFQTQFDMSGIAGGLEKLGAAAAVGAVLGMNQVYVRYEEQMLNIIIPKSEIKDAQKVKKGLMKQVVVILKDGSVHTFDYGILSVDKIFEAVKA